MYSLILAFCNMGYQLCQGPVCMPVRHYAEWQEEAEEKDEEEGLFGTTLARLDVKLGDGRTMEKGFSGLFRASRHVPFALSASIASAQLPQDSLPATLRRALS